MMCTAEYYVACRPAQNMHTRKGSHSKISYLLYLQGMFSQKLESGKGVTSVRRIVWSLIYLYFACEKCGVTSNIYKV